MALCNWIKNVGISWPKIIWRYFSEFPSSLFDYHYWIFCKLAFSCQNNFETFWIYDNITLTEHPSVIHNQNWCSFYLFQVHSILMVALWEESTKFTLLPLKQSWTSVVLNCPNAWMTNISTVSSSRSPDTQKEKSSTPKRRYMYFIDTHPFFVHDWSTACICRKKITFELKNPLFQLISMQFIMCEGDYILKYIIKVSLHVFFIVCN